MSKPTITKLFIGSLIALVAGLLVTIVAGVLAVANAGFESEGSQIVGVHVSNIGWGLVALAVCGVLAMIGGAIGQFIAWIGAVINTAHLDDKTWFVLLLVLGLFGFGFIVMIVYLIVGPDGTRRPEPAPYAPWPPYGGTQPPYASAPTWYGPPQPPYGSAQPPIPPTTTQGAS